MQRPLGPDGYFDERVAATYDERTAAKATPETVGPIVEFLVGLAGSGRALEPGIGTGRIAIPLAQRGVPVHGIELSKAMVARLRAKPGAEQIGVTIGDFATTTVEGMFSLAYLVANTIMNLTSQDEQVACFQNVAAHLEPGGCFVIEVLVPGLRRLPPGETFQPFDVSPTHLGFDEYDVARQGLVSHLLDWRREGRGLLSAVPVRVAGRARPDGAARRNASARAVGRLEAGAIHEREPPARVCVGEATMTELRVARLMRLSLEKRHGSPGAHSLQGVATAPRLTRVASATPSTSEP